VDGWSDQDWSETLEESLKRLEERNRLIRIAERRAKAPYLRLVSTSDGKPEEPSTQATKGPD